MTDTSVNSSRSISAWLTPGVFWLMVAVLGAGVFFADGLDALLVAWQLPEYSHGPLIPVLSGLLFLRQLKEFPVDKGPKRKRWIGLMVVLFAIAMGALGRMANIPDIVAYATILWVGGILLISFGWSTGKHFWPPVLHLVYMLPLPGVLYYKMSASLQLISSELGVWFLGLLSVPVFLSGNIIDLGVYKLHVAEACSGLRYLFPILSFSYIFSVLYRGPMWHKAVLLISAAPITIVMNSVRIAVAGMIVNVYGVGWVEGFSHFFEGWVIFIACIGILFLLARIMLFFNPEKMSLVEALDLDTTGLGFQAARVRFTQASVSMISAAVIMLAVALSWNTIVPERGTNLVDRAEFITFPRDLGGWVQRGSRERLSPAVAANLAADDYHSAEFINPAHENPVSFFSAWYDDQSAGGVHSPEICLPGGGWEIAWLERSDLTEALGWETTFELNRAIIQKGETRMMVYYWFDQKGRKIAWDFEAKFWLMVDGIRTGRTDGALVRLTTPIGRNEDPSAADARLMDMLREVLIPLEEFVPAN